MVAAQFLEQLLADEVSRRDARSAAGRAARAGLLPLMRLETWTEPDNLTYDRQVLSDLTTQRIVEAGHKPADPGRCCRESTPQQTC
jgi:hypothetical protein